MKKLIFMLALVLAGTIAAPAAEARDHVGIYANVGCCGYYGGYYGPPAYYSPYYYPSYYVAPPPVVYAVPPPSPLAYAAPPPVEAAVPPTAPTQAANQTSPTFIDSAGRTCRHYQSTSGGPAFGTACLQEDGTWRATQ